MKIMIFKQINYRTASILIHTQSNWSIENDDSRKSKIFRNPAMLLPNSPAEWNVEFFNIAFSANIDSQKFSPEKILEIVKKIEKNLGRKEREKWSPREIDIDILAIGDLQISLGDKLTIPHPGLLERDFFIQTVREIEPGF